MTTPIKAIRVTITLGDIKLDVFQLLNGDYGFSCTGIAKLLGLSSDKRVREILTSKSLEANTRIALGLGKNEEFSLNLAKVSTNDSGNINFLPLDLFMLVVGYEAQNGNQMAVTILMASLAESIERRADAARGIQRSEEERNDRLKFRVQVGKVSRRTLTDAIGSWLENPENDASENTKRFIYANCSDHLNKIVLGHKSRIAKEILGVSPDSLLRDYLPLPALKELDAVERLATILIDEDNTHPLEAVKQAIVAVRAKRITID